MHLPLDQWDPTQIVPEALDVQGDFCWLAVLDRRVGIADLQALLLLLTEKRFAEEAFSVALYLTPDAQVSETEVYQLVSDLPNQVLPNLMLLFEAEIRGHTPLLSVMCSCQALLEWGDFGRETLIWQAMALNLQTVLYTLPEALRGYENRLVWHLPEVLSEQAELLQRVMCGLQRCKGMRGFLTFLAWQNETTPVGLKVQTESIVKQWERVSVTCVLFWGRSGSTFLHSLLDGHPEVLSVGACNFFAISHFYSHWMSMASRQPRSFDEIIRILCQLFRFDPTRPQSEATAIFSETIPYFEKLFYRICHHLINALAQSGWGEALKQNPRKHFFLLFYYAYALALGQDLRHKQQLVHQLHWCEDLLTLSQMKEDFPQLSLLGMIRPPVRGLFSMLAFGKKMQRSARQDDQFDFPDLVLSLKYINAYRHILMGWRMAERLMGKSVYAINLEALHQEPHPILTDLCQWLKISWCDSLLNSTEDGVPFGVDSGVHGTIDGQMPVFDPRRAQYAQWSEWMHPIEVFALNGILKAEIEKYHLGSVPQFQRSLAYLLLLVPTRIEGKAFLKALQQQNGDDLKHVVLSVLERYYFTFLFLCGYDTFLTRDQHHIRPGDPRDIAQ